MRQVSGSVCRYFERQTSTANTAWRLGVVIDYAPIVNRCTAAGGEETGQCRHERIFDDATKQFHGGRREVVKWRRIEEGIQLWDDSWQMHGSSDSGEAGKEQRCTNRRLAGYANCNSLDVYLVSQLVSIYLETSPGVVRHRNMTSQNSPLLKPLNVLWNTPNLDVSRLLVPWMETPSPCFLYEFQAQLASCVLSDREHQIAQVFSVMYVIVTITRVGPSLVLFFLPIQSKQECRLCFWYKSYSIIFSLLEPFQSLIHANQSFT